METLVKTLKASINVDTPKLGVLSLSLKNTNNYVQGIQLYSDNSFKVKCISGTLYNSDTLQTVELSAGEEKSYSGNSFLYFAGNSEATIEIGNIYKLEALKLYYINFSTSSYKVSQFAKYTTLHSLINKTNTFGGRLEDYISNASKYGKSTYIKIENSWVTFGANAETYGTTYYCDFATDSSVVTIKDTDASGAVLGTYNKTTGVWTYA